MSMTVQNEADKATDFKTRSALATRYFCEALGVGVVSPKNLGYLTLALTEAVTREIEHDATLRDEIRTLYEELVPQKTPRSRATNTSPTSKGQTSARASGSRRPGPNDPPDIQWLAQQYSGDSLFAHLKKYDLPALKKAVKLVQEQHPNTKPKNASKKDDIVSYLLEYAL